MRPARSRNAGASCRARSYRRPSRCCCRRLRLTRPARASPGSRSAAARASSPAGHIGKDQSVALLQRIPGLAHPIAFEPAFGLARLLEAAPLGVEQPAVIAAANPALLDAAVIERGAAMAAARLHQSRLTAPVTEQNEVFAQDADGLGRRAGIGNEPDRMPVASQQFAHGLATPDFGQGGIVGCGLARVAGAGIDSLGRHVASPWHDVLLQASMSLNLTKSTQAG